MSDGVAQKPEESGAFKKISSDFSCAVSFPWPNAAGHLNRETPSAAATSETLNYEPRMMPRHGQLGEHASAPQRPPSNMSSVRSPEVRSVANAAPSPEAFGSTRPAYWADGMTQLRPESAAGPSLSMPVAVSVAACTLLVALTVTAGMMFFNDGVSREKRNYFARFTSSPSDVTPPSAFRAPVSFDPGSQARNAETTMWRDDAFEAPPNRAPERPTVAPGENTSIQSQPVTAWVPTSVAVPRIIQDEQLGASGTVAGEQSASSSPISGFGMVPQSGNELWQTGDDALRRGDVAAAVAFYERSMKAIELEHSLPTPRLSEAEGAGVGALPAEPREAAVSSLPANFIVREQEEVAFVRPALMSPAKPTQEIAPSPPDPADVARFAPATFAILMRHGDAALQRGDISGARALYQRAASLDASAATAHIANGKTYDPRILTALGVRGGALPDVAKAAQWYGRAQTLGDPAASEFLNRLR